MERRRILGSEAESMINEEFELLGEIDVSKLQNGFLHSAPKIITLDGRTINNPSADKLAELGYKSVVYTDMPTDAPSGQHYESGWEEGDKIVQTWTLTDDPVYPEPELSAEEALNIIMGVVQ